MNLLSTYDEKLKALGNDPESMMDYMLEAAPYIQRYTDAKSTTEKAKIFQEYKINVDKEGYIPSNADVCDNCGGHMEPRNGFEQCMECGYVGVPTLDDLTYQEEIETNVVGVYTYKRMNHFSEWLSQFQAAESTTIPKDVIENVTADMKKTRMAPSELNRDRLRAILKKLKLSKFYEHIPSILYSITKVPPKKLTPDLEEKMRTMFSEIQAPFARHCPPERKNFLSYSYVLHKFCQLLDADEYLECFPLLKSREKLKACDEIWKHICMEMQYEFIPTI